MEIAVPRERLRVGRIGFPECPWIAMAFLEAECFFPGGEQA